MSSNKPDAPKRNNDGSKYSLPSVSLMRINHLMASSTVRTPPAGFKPICKMKIWNVELF